MQYVGVAALKARLSAYLARVQAGEEIVVADRGRPVARLVPLSGTGDGEEKDRLRDLERRGLVRVGSGGIPAEYWGLDLPPDPTDSVRAALEEERSEGW